MIALNKAIDHTLLNPAATREEIRTLCAQAAQYDFASVCVNPCHVPLARRLLESTEVRVCTVIGFPLGAGTPAAKAAETRDALMNGCNEFDMVINIGALKDGDEETVLEDIRGVVDAAQGRVVKVIIETGLLTDGEKALATRLACRAGAHFVKTCTGFAQGAATAADVTLMKNNLTGEARIKASAGVRTYEQAKRLLDAGASRLGTSAGVQIVEEWRKLV